MPGIEADTFCMQGTWSTTELWPFHLSACVIINNRGHWHQPFYLPTYDKFHGQNQMVKSEQSLHFSASYEHTPFFSDYCCCWQYIALSICILYKSLCFSFTVRPHKWIPFLNILMAKSPLSLPLGQPAEQSALLTSWQLISSENWKLFL